MSGHRSPGFGLLEAIVALALLAGAGMALFGWINTNLQHALKLRETEIASRLTTRATEWAWTINPAVDGQGELRLGDSLLRWTTRPLTPRTSTQPFLGGISTPFHAALFAIDILVETPDLDRPYPVTLVRVGTWREPVTEILQ